MKQALESVNKRMLAAWAQRNSTLECAVEPNPPPRLVAVSKLKPVSDIIEAYTCGQRFFGENYIQELETKANCPEILAQCPDIRWHFIGHLQSNKVNKLLKIRNLHAVETVDSPSLAKQIDKAIDRYQSESGVGPSLSDLFCGHQRLKVMVQVNTSGEEQKNGLKPAEAFELASYIVSECKWLELIGLMTIGRIGEEFAEDYRCLYKLRSDISSRLPPAVGANLELSMGMSGDFEEAIRLGSTNVRVGSSIFGARPPKGT